MATDYERLRNMTDDDIDCSDIPPLEESMKKDEWIWGVAGSEHVSMLIDGKVFNYFKDTGKGYLNRLNILVNSLLADYVAKQQAQGAVI